MNRYIYMILTAAVSLFAFASCNEEQGDLFDTEVSGIYFNYTGASNSPMSTSRNFAEYFIQDSTQLTLFLDIITLGYNDSVDRTAIVRAKTLEEYPMADIEFDERLIIPANETSRRMMVRINRPADTQTKYGVTLYFDTDDAASDFGAGIAGRNEYSIVCENSFDKPSDWETIALPYYGEYSTEKHQFLLKALGTTNVTASAQLGQYNRLAVIAAREAAAENPDAEIPDFPFWERNPYDAQNRVDSYGEPYYWDSELTEMVGNWFSVTNNDLYFVRFAQYMGLTTATERDFFADKVQAHKGVIKYLMEYYNEMFRTSGYGPYNEWGTQYNGFSCARPRSDVDYDVVRPAQWENEGVELLRPYYGEYSDEKYKFMINVLVEKSEKVAGYLPYMFGMAAYDMSFITWEIWDDEEDEVIGMYSGEDDVKAYNLILREAATAAGHPDWFPEVKE